MGKRQKRGLPRMPMDEHLLSACDKLPPCSGIALGLDRLLMVATAAKTIDAVIALPTVRA